MAIQIFKVKILSELDQLFSEMEIAGCIQDMTGIEDENIEVKEIK